MGKDKIELANTGEKIIFFIQKYRKALLALVIIIVVGIASSVAFFTIRDGMAKKAIAKAEGFERRINEAGILYGDPFSAEATALLDELNAYAPSTFGYAAARSYALAADIYFARKEWKMAEESWINASRKAPKIFLSSISLYNAAVAAEEQGQKEAAIEHFNECLDYKGIFPAAPKAYFNIGRLHEELHNMDKAVEAYLALIENNPDSPLANLARNRLIILDRN